MHVPPYLVYATVDARRVFGFWLARKASRKVVLRLPLDHCDGAVCSSASEDASVAAIWIRCSGQIENKWSNRNNIIKCLMGRTWRRLLLA
jgi:hypothetical protein